MKIEDKSFENTDALNQKLFHSIHSLDSRTTDTQIEVFFSKILYFWVWADKLGRKCLVHLGYFQPIYQHPFWYMFSINQPLFLQKTKPLYPSICFDLGFEFGMQRIYVL